MKAEIHPNYQQTKITCACGNVIEVGSTKKDIRVRMAGVMEDVWPPKPATKVQPPDPKLRIKKSDFIKGGKLDVKDVIQPIYDEINKKYGLQEKPGEGE